MNAAELRSKTPEEISRHLNELQQEQFKLRLGKATGQLSRTHRMGEVRRDIARARTILAQKGK